MVEKIVQKEEEERPEDGNRLFKLPKHIKQIGRGGNCPEIYIEDYAEGYLRRLAGSDYAECRVAVLVGEFIKSEGKRYVFIRGAIEAEDVMEDNVARFTSDAWAGVYEKIKRYFPYYEAVGWFLGGPEFLTEVNDAVRQTHLDWFGGRDRVLFKIDPVEKDAVFYLYDKGELKQWPGYCIYYEKNEEMQDYLVAGAPASVDAGYTEPVLAELGKRMGRTEEDGAIRQEHPTEPENTDMKRKAIKERKPEKGGGRHGTGIAVAAVLLAIGAFALRGRESELAGILHIPAPVPTAGVYNQAEEGESQVQTNARPEPSVTVLPEVMPEGILSGSIFESDFKPVDEEPYIPGAGRKEETEDVTPTKAVSTETVPVPTEAPSDDNDVIVTDAMELYIVQRGDTLAGICRRYYGDTLRIEEVKGINQIPDENWIYAGQELYLP